MTGRSLQDIENSFDDASMNEDVGQISELARKLAIAVAKGIHSGSPMYREFIEPLKAAFAEGIDSEFDTYIKSDGVDDDDAETQDASEGLVDGSEGLSEEQQRMVSFINENLGDHPGSTFFGYPNDVAEFDGLWASGNYADALAILDGIEDLQISTLEELQDYLK